MNQATHTEGLSPEEIKKKRVLTEEQKQRARDRARAWNKANPGRVAARVKEWRIANPEKDKAMAKAGRERNMERTRLRVKEKAYWRTLTPEQRAKKNERQRNYNKTHRDEERKRAKLWKVKNPEKVKAARKRYQNNRAEYQREYRKKYIANNKDRAKAWHQKHVDRNRDSINARRRTDINRKKSLDAYYRLTPEQKLARLQKQKMRRDPVKEAIIRKRSYARNRHKWVAKERESKRLRRQNDPVYRLSESLRARISALLRGIKCASGAKLVGCTRAELMEHLEKQFRPGMSWATYGYRGWHADHKMPISSYRLEIEEEQKKAFHFSNLQPLWWWENLQKGDKIIDEIAT